VLEERVANEGERTRGGCQFKFTSYTGAIPPVAPV